MCAKPQPIKPMFDLVSHHDGSKGHTRTGLHEPIAGSHLPQAHKETSEAQCGLEAQICPEKCSSLRDLKLAERVFPKPRPLL